MNIPQEAVAIMIQMANDAGLHGQEIRCVHWIPPQSATQSHVGAFAIEYEYPRTGSGVPTRP
jgi:hypothetical protein